MYLTLDKNLLLYLCLLTRQCGARTSFVTEVGSCNTAEEVQEARESTRQKILFSIFDYLTLAKSHLFILFGDVSGSNAQSGC